MRRICFLLLSSVLTTCFLYGQSFVKTSGNPGDFPIVTISGTTQIYVNQNEDWLVQKAAVLLQQDIEMVTGRKPEIVFSIPSSEKNMIIIGTIRNSTVIHDLITSKKINAGTLQNKWEAFSIQTVTQPFQGVRQALVIAGSDRRGAAYGVFTLSEQIGVSPWYWWADVPVKKQNQLFIKQNFTLADSPKVKYRGIFINDEAPAFAGWTKEKFGGVNHRVYEKIFELLLRLKSNYLWPAMWGNAFNDDDSLNPILADRWGIVMGTSHHEPMLRAQQEWKRYGHGPWDYTQNDTALRAFWKKGIENMGHHESIVTIGMRGDGDMPMTEGTAIELLEKIVTDQRKILESVTGKPASETPQLWALYKEVQDYYDKGMRVPDDVTLLLCDDNWGNIRRLPKENDKPRTGGYGIYYHFDYVGDPRNYKWINTNNIARVWEQMHLAYEHDVKNIWIVNVGDLKPMEFPISFFLQYAWNPDRWNEENLNDFYTRWAAAQFGMAHAIQIGNILKKYGQYASRKKPELLNEKTYSLENFHEAQRVTGAWNMLLRNSEKIYGVLPEQYRNAFFQLILHPVKAYANLQNLYTSVAWNHYYAKENDTRANKYAADAKRFYLEDSLISAAYNGNNHGRWNHMMDQTHIGYTYWQQPDRQTLPLILEPDKNAEPVSKKFDLKPHDHDNAFVRACKSENIQRDFFYEKNGYVSIEAAHYTEKREGGRIRWKIIPGIGRDGDGITSFPVTEPSSPWADDQSPVLDYQFYSYDTGSFSIHAFFSPTLNISDRPDGLQYGISVDQEEPQIISINKDDHNQKQWSQWVADNIIIKTTSHTIGKKEMHKITFYRVSPAVILQKIVVDFGGMKKSYLGPEETIIKSRKQ